MTLLTMRPYQEDAVQATEAAWDAGTRRPAIVVPTGGGKTVIFSHVGSRFRRRQPRKRVLYLAHRAELIEQAAAKLRSVMPGERVGIVKAARNETMAPHVVASVQTLANPLRRAQLFDVGAVVVDEAHHAAAATYVTVLEHFGCLGTKPFEAYGREPAVALGVTATMIRGDDKALGDIWEDVVYTTPIGKMIADGWLVRPYGKRVKVADFSLDGVRKTAGDFNAAGLGAALEGSVAPEAVAKALAEHAIRPDGLLRQTILFAPLVRTAELFCEAIRDAGLGVAEVISDRTPDAERRELLERFRRGEVRVLCNAMLLTEGTDLPMAECIVVARPTLNPGLYVQMVGRGLRLCPEIGKVDCLVLLVAGMHRHTLELGANLFGTEDVFAFEEDEIGQEEGSELEDLSDETEIELLGGGGLEDPEFLNGVPVAEDVDLFGGSGHLWLSTAAGVRFLAPGDRYIAIIPLRTSQGAVFDVVSMHQTHLGDSRMILEGVESLGYAMAWAEQDVTPQEKRRTTMERDWRSTKPSYAQKTTLRRMGLEAPRGALAGEIDTMIRTAAATWRIDSRLRGYLERRVGR